MFFFQVLAAMVSAAASLFPAGLSSGTPIVYCGGQTGWEAEILQREDGTPVARWYQLCDGVRVLFWAEIGGAPPVPTARQIVERHFPENPDRAWAVLLCEGDNNKDGQPDQDLIDLRRRGTSGELTPWQIHPGNFPTIGELPIPGDFEQQTRLARIWLDLIKGEWDAIPGGWTCAR